MDLSLADIIDFLHAAARSVGAEVTSPWFYLQLGIILAGAGISLAAGTAIRSRIDMASLGMDWPAPLRLFMRVLVGSASGAIFAFLMRTARIVMNRRHRARQSLPNENGRAHRSTPVPRSYPMPASALQKKT